MTTATEEDLLLTVSAVAALAGVADGLVLKWIDTGQLAAVTLAAGVPERRKRGRKTLRVYRSAWGAFVASRTLAASGAAAEPAAPAKRSHAAERLRAAGAAADAARAKLRAGRGK